MKTTNLCKVLGCAASLLLASSVLGMDTSVIEYLKENSSKSDNSFFRPVIIAMLQRSLKNRAEEKEKAFKKAHPVLWFFNSCFKKQTSLDLLLENGKDKMHEIKPITTDADRYEALLSNLLNMTLYNNVSNHLLTTLMNADKVSYTISFKNNERNMFFKKWLCDIVKEDAKDPDQMRGQLNALVTCAYRRTHQERGWLNSTKGKIIVFFLDYLEKIDKKERVDTLNIIDTLLRTITSTACNLNSIANSCQSTKFYEEKLYEELYSNVLEHKMPTLEDIISLQEKANQLYEETKNEVQQQIQIEKQKRRIALEEQRQKFQKFTEQKQRQYYYAETLQHEFAKTKESDIEDLEYYYAEKVKQNINLQKSCSLLIAAKGLESSDEISTAPSSLTSTYVAIEP